MKKIVAITLVFGAGLIMAISYLSHGRRTEVLPVVQLTETEIKYKEMLRTCLLVDTINSLGSGIIIDKTECSPGIFRYYALTNAHVTECRFVESLTNVDGLTGKVSTKTMDTGCTVVSYHTIPPEKYKAAVIDEDVDNDLALLLFETASDLPVAMIATDEILDDIRVFDDVFAIGCQLGESPSPSSGIVSRIINTDSGENFLQFYGSTAPIAPGSSGGGLFKYVSGHYYLIGVPFSVSLARNGQLMTHLTFAIPISTAKRFIDQCIGSRQCN